MVRIAGLSRWGSALPMLGALALPACGDGISLRLGGQNSGTGGSDDGGPPDNVVPPEDAPPDAPPGCIDPALLGLLDEVRGYGEATRGGADGCVYTVENSDDDGRPGSLRDAVERLEPLWIVFDADYDIALTAPLLPRSNKTIDGRGRKITLRDYPLRIDNQSEIIIESIAFEAPTDEAGLDISKNDHDAITLLGSGTQNVWINHCSFSGYADDHIDLLGAATFITISWSRFTNQDEMINIGTQPEDDSTRSTRVTMHHNFFNGAQRYHPRLRYGYVHSFNNIVNDWIDWAAGAAAGGQLYSEANWYIAARDDQDVFKTNFGSEDATNGFIHSEPTDRIVLEDEASPYDQKPDMERPIYAKDPLVRPADDELRWGVGLAAGPR